MVDRGWTEARASGEDAGLGTTAATTMGKGSAPMVEAPTEKITVYLLDDHEIVRLGLKDLLESEGDIEVVGESGSVAHAQAQILALQPQVAVLDGRLPDGSGIDVCREIRSRDPNIAALILTSSSSNEVRILALQPQVAVLDGRLPDGSDIDVCREIRSRDPNIAALILTSSSSNEVRI